MESLIARWVIFAVMTQQTYLIYVNVPIVKWWPAMLTVLLVVMHWRQYEILFYSVVVQQSLESLAITMLLHEQRQVVVCFSRRHDGVEY
jgi:branched-subunit amino acid transport protein AzlD